MNYKAHFEKFVSDVYKRFDDDDERRRSLQEIAENYKKTHQKLNEITEALNKPIIEKPIDLIDNAQFINLMGISQKTAQTWRDTGVISFSQIGNKIYYRISDLENLLEKNYRKANKI